jgi:SpoVK/Ycf46/Vps4 family AAA+-type ATPase
VSFDEYVRATRAQAAHPKPSRAVLQEIFSDMVITDRMLDELGPSLVTHKSIFLYGPTGNGKTSIAERLLRVYRDSVVMPYAVLVGGHVINVYDPAGHQEIQVEDEYLDRRWVVCRRPFILVGGELVNSMLELRLDENSGVYAAPLQMKANNGIFVIDDFGRQVISPRELLNRWIIPLDRRVDYLTLSHGVKFQIPFELLVVFSTNISPSELADEAFLRRIHTKVYVDAVGPDEFDQIFGRLVAKKSIPAAPGSSEALRDMCKQYSESGGLRACYPGDIIEIVQGICDYEERPAQITREELLRAVGLYFTKHD